MFCYLYFCELPQYQFHFQMCQTKMTKMTPLSLPAVLKLFLRLRDNMQKTSHPETLNKL